MLGPDTEIDYTTYDQEETLLNPCFQLAYHGGVFDRKGFEMVRSHDVRRRGKRFGGAKEFENAVLVMLYRLNSCENINIRL